MPTQKELNDKYGNNLSATSNDRELVLRDPGGNLILPDGNESIYIEPIKWAYENNSVNNIINTRFSYYKFPPKLIIEDEILEPIVIEPIDIKYYSRYQAEPQLMPVIDCLTPNLDGELKNKILYGPVVNAANGTRKYAAAQAKADEEVLNGVSSGRYFKSQDEKFPGWQTGSLFEGHFRPIKFTELIDGTPYSTPGKFVITQDIFNSKKSFQFDIKVSISHTDDHLRNAFMVRLVRGRNEGIYKQYSVVKLTSTAVQGSIWRNKDGLSPAQMLEMTKKKNEMDTAKTAYELADVTYNQKDKEAKTFEKDVYKPAEAAYKVAYEAWLAAFNIPGLPAESWKVVRDNFNRADLYYRAYKKQWEKMAGDAWNVYRVESENAKLAYNTATNAYNNLAYVANNDVTNPEFVLNGQKFSSWIGRSEFNITHIIDGAALDPANISQLYDTYWVEILALKPLVDQHEFIEEQTYWDIRELG